MLKKVSLLVLLVFVVAVNAMAATPDEIEESVAKGVAWLAEEQDLLGDGSWWGSVAHTGLAVLKLEDRAIELGYSPFDEDYEYSENVIAGLNFLFEHANTRDIWGQPAGDPDTDGDGLGVHWWNGTYTTGIAMMAISASRDPGRVVGVGPLAGWTYEEVVQDAVDYFAFGQIDAGPDQGGWTYDEVDNDEHWGDNSNSGYATLGLGFAEGLFGSNIPQFVKDELSGWIDALQDDVDGDPNDGGSWYTRSWPEEEQPGVNILKTGNLLFEMALVGDTLGTPRVQDAIDYIERHWDDPNPDPGWRGDPSHKQAMFCAMKGLEIFVIQKLIVGAVERDWYDEFADAIIAEQQPDGYWEHDWQWGDHLLDTTWALLTLQRVIPPITVALDVKPTSCRNPFNVGKKGVLPVAILGTEDFDPKEIDPATIRLGPVGGEVVPPIRWDLEDVATPYDGVPSGEDAYECTEEGPDGFMDLTLKFDAQEVATALGAVNDGDIILLSVIGNLREELGGRAIRGVDVIQILKKGKKAPAVSCPTCVLEGSYPNPFNPEVWIPYRLGEGVEVKVTIYSGSGHLVRTLDLGYRSPGEYLSKGKAAYWDGRNEAGELASSGIYFYTFQAGDFTAIRKIVMIK